MDAAVVTQSGNKGSLAPLGSSHPCAHEITATSARPLKKSAALSRTYPLQLLYLIQIAG